MTENARPRGALVPASRRISVWIALVLITGLGAFLRVHRLGDLPPGLFCDEAALGYNAYSLLKTGRDETGAFLPLYVWSFGVSYKNPVFIYSAIAPVAAFGLNELAVRLTSAAYGVATVAAMFFLGRALIGPAVGLLAALFLAICPWHLHFSRIAFELITFPFFCVMGTTFLVRFAQGRRTLWAAALLFGLALYTYAIAKLFVPLFLLAFALLYRPQLMQRKRESLQALLALLLVALPLIAFDLTHREQTTAYFRNNAMLAGSDGVFEALQRFAENYDAFLLPRFLFEEGDPLYRHAVQGHGELYWAYAPLLLLGLLAIVALRKRREVLLVLWWLLLYPVGPALMTEIPSASRGIIGAPVLCLIAAMGGGALLALPARRMQRPLLARTAQAALLALGAWALIPAVREYWGLYTREYPLYAAKYYTGFQYGHRDAVRRFLEVRERYDRLILSPTLNNQPYIFLLFYSAYSPAIFQRDGLAGLERDTGMSVADPASVDLYQTDERLLLAVLPQELSLFSDYQRDEEVRAPDGTPAFALVDSPRLRDFVHHWWLNGPYPFDDASAPPDLRANGMAAGLWYFHGGQRAEVDVGQIVSSSESWNCAWAVNELESSTDRTARVFAGFDVTGEVWVNGLPVALSERARPSDNELEQRAAPDSWVGVATLRAGRNHIAVRSCASVYAWRFYFRLTELDGRPLEDARWRWGDGT